MVADSSSQSWRFGPKPILGLMGAPGAGKSAAASLFAEAGCAVVDADQLAHDAIQADHVRAQLRGWWGDGVFDASGAVNRKAVGAIVFADKGALKKLEALIHPIVHRGRAELRRRYMQDASVQAVVEDCPLLIESGLDEQCDRLVFIDCPEPIRLQRLQDTRGWDAEEAKKRQEHQLPLDTKRRSADYVIDNGEPFEVVRKQVREVLEQLQQAER